MVQSCKVETLSVEIIKVTIKDKPDWQKQKSEDEYLSEAFKALKEHALQERKVREFRNKFEKKISQEQVRRCFRVWHECAKRVRKISEQVKAKRKLSNDQRIEQLVSILAEKQKETKGIVSRLQRKPFARKKAAAASATPSKSQKEADPIQTQKLLIQQQRAELVEQTKLIEQMQLKEIELESKARSKETIRVAKQALRQCNQRTRRSLVQLMREEGCRDHSIAEIPEPTNGENFFSRMEVRAAVRRQRMKQAEELRQRKRDEQKRKEEREVLEAEEKERQEQAHALIAARRARREQEKRRQAKLERQRALENAAECLYKRYLFRRYGLEPLNVLREEKYRLMSGAANHHASVLLSRVFVAWKRDWLEHRDRKLRLAAEFSGRRLLGRSFEQWKSFAIDIKQKSQVASEFYKAKLQGKFVRVLNLQRIASKLALQQKEQLAVSHYQKHVILDHFTRWKLYVETADEVRERDQRRDEWRDLIKKFIPAIRHVNSQSPRPFD